MTKVKYKIRLIKIDGYHQQNYDFYHIKKYNQFNSKLFQLLIINSIMFFKIGNKKGNN